MLDIQGSVDHPVWMASLGLKAKKEDQVNQVSQGRRVAKEIKEKRHSSLMLL